MYEYLIKSVFFMYCERVMCVQACSDRGMALEHALHSACIMAGSPCCTPTPRTGVEATPRSSCAPWCASSVTEAVTPSPPSCLRTPPLSNSSRRLASSTPTKSTSCSLTVANCPLLLPAFKAFISNLLIC